MDHEDWVVVFNSKSFKKAKRTVSFNDSEPGNRYYRLPYSVAVARARRWAWPLDTYRAKVFRAPREPKTPKV